MSSVNSWFMLGATVIGIVGAASVILVEHLRQSKKKHSMALDLARLDHQVTTLREQMEALKKAQQQTMTDSRKHRRRAHPKASSTASSSDDFGSARDLDSSDLEFYDLSDGSDEADSAASTITSLDTVLRDVDERLDSGSTDGLRGAHAALEALLLEWPGSADVQWRIGKAYYKMAKDPERGDEKYRLAEKAVSTLEEVLATHEECAEAYKWLVFALGMILETASLRERITGSLKLKGLLDKALSFEPNEIGLLYTLAKYHYEMAILKWYERKVFATIAGSVPACSFEEAISLHLAIEKVQKEPWKDNKYSLALCYIALTNYKEALRWLDEAKETEPLNGDDKINVEIETLLKKYDSYR